MQGPKGYPPTTRLAPHGMWMSHLPPGSWPVLFPSSRNCSLRSSPTPGCASLTQSGVWPLLSAHLYRSALPAPSLSGNPSGGGGFGLQSQKALRFRGWGQGFPPCSVWEALANFQILALSGQGGDCWAQTPHPKCHPAPPSLGLATPRAHQARHMAGVGGGGGGGGILGPFPRRETEARGDSGTCPGNPRRQGQGGGDGVRTWDPLTPEGA